MMPFSARLRDSISKELREESFRAILPEAKLAAADGVEPGRYVDEFVLRIQRLPGCFPDRDLRGLRFTHIDQIEIVLGALALAVAHAWPGYHAKVERVDEEDLPLYHNPARRW